MDPGLDLKFEFRTPEQESFFALRKRNQMFSGGFGNGKTYAGCMKVIYLMTTFPFYRVAALRFDQTKLRETTMKTFFKVCPPGLYDPKIGGNRTDSLNKCTFFNGSEILFMHLKDVDESIVRGLEVDTILIDQAEEITEYMYLMINARIGRWDQSQVPQFLLNKYTDWPREHNRYKVPSYFLGLCNPDSELHWIYKRFHPDSEEFQNKYIKNHEMVQGETTSATISEELLESMMENDGTWVDRFIRGKWGIPGGAIHKIDDSSILTVGKDIDLDFVKKIILKGNLSRVLDHGDVSPTCCIWFSNYKNQYFAYREYYKPDALISEHRKNIFNLSESETYVSNLIDPACKHKTMQKYGQRWSVIDEYSDPNLFDEYNPQNKKLISVPPLHWTPGDNDELSTRNRISELLTPSRAFSHPVTNISPAPRLYFIERSPDYPNGCFNAIKQIRAQKRKKVGTVDGKDMFSDDRDESVVDHAYDVIRYFCASHSLPAFESKPKLPHNSIGFLRQERLKYQRGGFSEVYGVHKDA